MPPEAATTPGADASAASASEVASQVPAQEADQTTEALDRSPNPPSDAGPGSNPDLDADLGDDEGKDSQAAADPKTDTEAKDDVAPDMIEVDFEGKKYPVPKELHRGYLREDDYTRKTQALSADRQALDARLSEVDQRAEVSEGLLTERAEVLALEQRVKSFENVDWDAAEENDPEAASKAWRRYQLLEKQLETARTTLKTKTDEGLAKQRDGREADLATRRKETGRVLAEKIEGFGPKLAEDIVTYGMNEIGLTVDEIGRMTDPRDWITLNRAMKAEKRVAELEKTLAGKATADNHEKAQLATPAAKTGGAAPPAGVRDGQGTKAWMESRNAQVRKSNGR